MIEFKNLSQETPFLLFKEKYHEALTHNQKNIEAFAISSFNKEKNEVNSRFVNIKFVQSNKFIFFTNYNSPKALDFKSHSQISGLFYWPNINFQLRIKADIKKTSNEYNNDYFKNRSPKKNALAISSKQSEPISSYQNVVMNYNNAIKKNNLTECPSYWGGFQFYPYYFEFWNGNDSRINKRLVFKKIAKSWEKFIIQP